MIVVRPSGSLPLVEAGLKLEDSFLATSFTEIPAANWYDTWSEFPLTVKSGNGLVISGSGLAHVEWALWTSSINTSFTRGLRMKVNGTVVLTDEGTGYPRNFSTDNVQLNNGDVVTFDFYGGGSITSQRTAVDPTAIKITPMTV